MAASFAEFRRDGRTNHPIRHTEISAYMGTYWRYYPSNSKLLRGASNPPPVGSKTK